MSHTPSEVERMDSVRMRRLTVSSHYPESRAAPHRRPLSVAVPMPYLRLQGRWLNEAGFAIGANVRVEVSAGRLVVEVVEANRAAERR